VPLSAPGSSPAKEREQWLRKKWEQEEVMEEQAMRLAEAEAEREFAVNRAEQELRDAMATMQLEKKMAQDQVRRCSN
jgi:hypothetical protein